MKNRLVFLVLLIMIAVGGFFFVQSSSRVPSTKIHTEVSPPISQNVNEFILVIKNNKLVSGPEKITVKNGDTVTMLVTADVDGEIHIHGYDLHIDLEKDKQGKLVFTADIEGRFPYEIEETKTEIGVLEVLPR